MSWLAVIIGGAIAGLIAKSIVPGNEPGGFVVDALIGICGGIVGKFLMPVIGLSAHSGNPLWNLLVAVVGAVIILAFYHLIAERCASKPPGSAS
ncbi:MAG TPA: GlsB/YeaQ/YmgE family stress response membrane protein [Armatimonadota bacterium]|nr:GlsB/YeaQ/YmgE family stress response membrane protein [Armatimonadota bacterium]